METGPQLTCERWSEILGSIGAAGGQVHCSADGEVVITLPANGAPSVPAAIQTIFHNIGVSQMASSLEDDGRRREVQEVALRLAHHAIVELIESVLG